VVEAQWANAFNGIAAAPGLNRYYASSNGGVAGFKGVFLLDENLEQLDVRKFDFDEAFDPRDGKLKGLSDFGWGGISNNANLHIGGLCCTEQEVYVPVGATSSEWNIGFVWKLSSDLGGPQELWALIAPGIDTSGPSFCAIDAQSGLLYTVAGGPATHFHAFDPKNNFAYVDSIELEVPLKGGAQGAAFGRNRRLYVTAYEDNNIYEYSALNGALLGSRQLIADDDGGEIEGFGIGTMMTKDGEISVTLGVGYDKWWGSEVKVLQYSAPVAT
jgi:hypothetical protein